MHLFLHRLVLASFTLLWLSYPLISYASEPIPKAENAYTLLHEPKDFLRLDNPELLSLVQKQMPANAVLLAVYIPKESLQAIDRGRLEQITKLVTIYKPSGGLNPPDKGFELFWRTFESALAGFIRMPDDAKNEYLSQELEAARAEGKNVYVAKSGTPLTQQFTYMLNFPLAEGKSLLTFLSTGIILQENKIFMVSATNFSLADNLYEDMEWTRQTTATFIPLLNPVAPKAEPEKADVKKK